MIKLSSLKHTQNLSTFRKIWVQKITHKKLLGFFEKSHWKSKTILHLHPKQKTLSIEITSRFRFIRLEIFFNSENMNFLVIFRYLQISFAVKSSGVDQVLTKILQIDQKLTFNIFHIWINTVSPKLKKISDGTDPPKKRSFLGGV